MSFDPLTAALDLGKIAINKIWPDPAEAARETLKLETLYQQGDLAKLQAQVGILQGQLQVNLQEAKHPSIFVAGWRPAVGWICAVSLAYTYIIHSLLTWGLVIAGSNLTAPPLPDSGDLMVLLLGMLGIGMQRSYDKKNGKDTKGISK
jgi:hypothetical protein